MIGRVPVVVGKRSKTHQDKWYIDLLNYANIQAIVKGVQGAPVWICDDTALFNHESINDKLVEAYAFTDENDDVLTGDHGTHIAGIQACKDYGLFPENIKFGTAKVLRSSSGTGSIPWIVAGARMGLDKGYEVFNFSIGSDSPDSDLKKMFEDICANDKRFAVCAAGNDARETDYPAKWCSEIMGTISVGAVEADNSFTVRMADYSSPGDVTISMPGTDIYSTVPGNQYQYMSGTSMATPFVTALLSVAKGLNPAFNHQMCVDMFKKHATPVGDNVKASGYGFLNIAAFLEDIKTAAPVDTPKKVKKKSCLSRLFGR